MLENAAIDRGEFPAEGSEAVGNGELPAEGSEAVGSGELPTEGSEMTNREEPKMSEKGAAATS